MGRMENLGALAGATGALQVETKFSSAVYRLPAEGVSTLAMSIKAFEPEDAALILWAASDAFHCFAMSPTQAAAVAGLK